MKAAGGGEEGGEAGVDVGQGREVAVVVLQEVLGGQQRVLTGGAGLCRVEREDLLGVVTKALRGDGQVGGSGAGAEGFGVLLEAALLKFDALDEAEGQVAVGVDALVEVIGDVAGAQRVA